MHHIFISYGKENIEFARHLKRLLEDERFEVWMDETGINPSQKWWRTIEQNIRNCVAFIIIMSPEAQESDWVEREILLAEKLKKPIFPVLLAGESWTRLAERQYEDMTAGQNSSLSERLKKALREAVMSASNSSPLLPIQPAEVQELPRIQETSVLTETNLQETLYPHLLQRWKVVQSLPNEIRRGVWLGDAGQGRNDGTWEIQTPDPLGRGIYGPYISLPPNKYLVTFRLKIEDFTSENGRLVEIDVTSRAAEITFAKKTLTTQDFTKSNVYQNFYLIFDLSIADENFEFRIRTHPVFEARKMLVIDYVDLRAQKLSLIDQAELILGEGQFITKGDLTLNSDTYEVAVGKNLVQLTSTEHRLLRYFMENPDRVLSASHLLEVVWDYPPKTGDEYLVTAHMRNLCSKIERFGKKYIKFIVNTGWRLMPNG